MLWIALIVLLALAGGVLGLLLELVWWAVVLTVLGFVLAGVLVWRVVSARTGPADRVGR